MIGPCSTCNQVGHGCQAGTTPEAQSRGTSAESQKSSFGMAWVLEHLPNNLLWLLKAAVAWGALKDIRTHGINVRSLLWLQ